MHMPNVWNALVLLTTIIKEIKVVIIWNIKSFFREGNADIYDQEII